MRKQKIKKQILFLQLSSVRQPGVECGFTRIYSNLLELNVYGECPHVDIGFTKCMGKTYWKKCSDICHWK